MKNLPLTSKNYEMSSYYTVISKQEFTSLYRYGAIPISEDKMIIFGSDRQKLERELVRLFLNLPSFDGDEEYIIIEVAEPSDKNNRVDIFDVLQLIPLTPAAKKAYEMKFDSRLVFSDPIFDLIVEEVEHQIEIADKLRGAAALGSTVGIAALNVDHIDRSVIADAYKHRIEGKKSNEIEKGSFFINLLVYERYEFFPNSDLGYMYDVGEVYAHSVGLPSFKGSGFHQYLNSSREGLNHLKLSEIIQFIEAEDQIDSFKSKLVSNESRQYLSGAFFLKFKEELLAKDSIFETSIPQVVRHILNKDHSYEKELREAIYLLGVFFGYKKFYSDLYGTSDIAIFKSEFRDPVSADNHKELKEGDPAISTEQFGGKKESNQKEALVLEEKLPESPNENIVQSPLVEEKVDKKVSEDKSQKRKSDDLVANGKVKNKQSIEQEGLKETNKKSEEISLKKTDLTEGMQESKNDSQLENDPVVKSAVEEEIEEKPDKNDIEKKEKSENIKAITEEKKIGHKIPEINEQNKSLTKIAESEDKLETVASSQEKDVPADAKGNVDMEDNSTLKKVTERDQGKGEIVPKKSKIKKNDQVKKGASTIKKTGKENSGTQGELF